MKKHLYLTILLITAIGLGLLGCSEEDIFEKNAPQEINSIISQFSPETFSKVVSSDYKVDWNVSAPLEHSEELGLDYYEFEINLPENQVLATNKLYDTKQSLLAVKKESGQFDFYVAKYFMDQWKTEGKSVKDVSFSKMESFSGLLNVLDNNNQMVYAKRMDNGRVLGVPVCLNSDFNDVNIETRMEVDCEEVAIYHYIDRYHIEQGIPVRKYSDLVGISYERTCSVNYYPELNLEGGVPGTYYSQNGGGSYAGCNDPLRGCLFKIELELEEEIILDPTFVNTKAECVYNKLLNLSGGFKSAIQKFDGEFPVAHLRFSVRNDLGSSVAARTYLPVGNTDTPDYVITIGFNNNTSQAGLNFRPTLLSAKTMAHEIIHAEMYRKLLSLIKKGNIQGVTQTELNQLMANGDYPGIYDYYRRYGKGWQHEQMAAHYVQTIADITKEFDNASQLDQFYNDLAWEGLKGTQAWYNLLPSDTIRITDTVNNYIITNHNDVCQ